MKYLFLHGVLYYIVYVIAIRALYVDIKVYMYNFCRFLYFLALFYTFEMTYIPQIPQLIAQLRMRLHNQNTLIGQYRGCGIVCLLPFYFIIKFDFGVLRDIIIQKYKRYEAFGWFLLRNLNRADCLFFCLIFPKCKRSIFYYEKCTRRISTDAFCQIVHFVKINRHESQFVSTLKSRFP